MSAGVFAPLWRAVTARVIVFASHVKRKRVVAPYADYLHLEKMDGKRVAGSCSAF